MSGEELECATTTQASKWLFAQAATKLTYDKVTRTGSVEPLIVADGKQRFFLEIASMIGASCVIKTTQNKN